MMDLSKLPELTGDKGTGEGATSADAPAPKAAGPRRGAFCDRCGIALREGARFCDACGQATVLASAELTPLPPAEPITPERGDALGRRPSPRPSPGVPGEGVVAGARGEGGHTELLSLGIGPEVWVSAILGIIFMLMGLQFARYGLATLRGEVFDTTWLRGNQPVLYWDLPGGTAWSDSALFAFGAAMVVASLAMLLVWWLRQTWPAWTIALPLTAVGSLYNVFVSVKLLELSITPTISLLAVLFGGVAIFYQVGIARAMRGAI
jgi:xanthosine utilization system XapX-like protein